MTADPSGRGSDRPSISVVVASNRDPALLDACLESIAPQCHALGGELLVVRAGTPAEVAALAASRPRARFLAAPPEADIPRLRGIGLSEARGALVAQTEDHCVAGPDWLHCLLAAARQGGDVIGGGMGNARRERVVDCAAYFAEYGFFDAGRPAEPGGVPLLTGANVAYTRPVVAEVASWARAGEWENVVHQRLAARGASLRFVPEAMVYQNQRYGLGSFCEDRFEHGFNYARKRLEEEQGSGRPARLVKSLLLPVVLTWRVARAAGRRDPAGFLRALPVTVTFLGAWSMGEAAGYLKGPVQAPGKVG